MLVVAYVAQAPDCHKVVTRLAKKIQGYAAMSQAEVLESVETSLRHCRSLAAAIADDRLAYFIDMAISEARRQAPEDGQLPSAVEVSGRQKIPPAGSACRSQRQTRTKGELLLQLVVAPRHPFDELD